MTEPLKAKPVTQNIEFTIGKCPLCKSDLFANATVAIDFKIESVDYCYQSGNARLELDIDPNFQGISVHHDCHLHAALDGGE